MRRTIQPQLPIVHPHFEHEHTLELQVISVILDEEKESVALVYADLTRYGAKTDTGREGMTAEQVLRCIVIKQMNGFSYEELAFHLADSRSYRTFCRFGISDKTPKKPTLQRNIKRVRPETMEAINRILVRRACKEGIEKGRKVRIDCTVTETNIHHPTDSSLLWDCVRVLARNVRQVRELTGFSFSDHSRRAKRRYTGIGNCRSKNKRTKLYRDLLKVTIKTVSAADRAIEALKQYQAPDIMSLTLALVLESQLKHYIPLTRRVISQAEHRVLLGESVPSTEKLVSIFEPHTDIIKKDRRDTLYGHKLSLSSGASGLVLDCVILDGNPADSSLSVDMVERQAHLYGRPPKQVALDGGFASKTNLRDIKSLGVEDVAFHKRRGLKVSDMVKSSWVYRRLRNFRAGIEGVISFLKRCFGLDRCTWRSLRSFKAYTWSSIVSANLLLIARHKLN
jgi:IS5 family transposase